MRGQRRKGFPVQILSTYGKTEERKESLAFAMKSLILEI
jgi:hypothetical protein